MHGLFFDIGLGLGLATACGVRAYLPALLAGALGSAHALSVTFAHGDFHFLQAGWWLLLLAVALAASYLAQLRLRAERAQEAVRATVGAHGVALGALLFAGALAAHANTWWPGLIGGAAAAAMASSASAPLAAGARSRLRDRAAREALTVYFDAAALALAALVALLHPLGYLALALAGVLALRVRSRSAQRYAGLRSLRR